MNLHMCAKFGANRSSRLIASTYFLMCDPLNPQNTPWDIEGRTLFSLRPFPDESADVYQIWCQSVQRFDSFPRPLNLWPSKAPWGIEGRIVFSLCRFPDESADLHQIWCQSVQPFGSFPKHWNLWPPTSPEMPPGVLRGDLDLASPFQDEATDMNQSWCQSVQPFDSFPRLLNIWPLNQVPPCVSRGNLFGVYPFPDGSADVFSGALAEELLIFCRHVRTELYI